MPLRPRPGLLSSLGLAAALLAPPLLTGCSNSDLVETSVPAEGIELRYDLQPGATFDGHVRRRETISMRGQPMTRSINFTVQLVVNGIEEDGKASVAATVSNIDLNWVIPGLQQMGLSTNEFNAQAKARLEGVTIRFGVEPDGTVVDIPAAPAGLADAEIGVLDSIIEGLTSAFFQVPSERITADKGWENEDSRGREGKLGKYTKSVTRGTLAGVYEHRETKQNLAKLEIEGDKTETTTTKDGSSEIRSRSNVTVLWDLKASYMASIDSKSTRTQGANTTTIQFDADWTRSIAGAGAAGDASASAGDKPPEDDAQVQSIEDPCDDNYVGPQDCTDPCNVNYMGEEACETTDEAAGADAEAGADAGESGDGEAPADDAGKAGE